MILFNNYLQLIFSEFNSLVEMFHNTVIFLSYIFVVFFLDFFLIFLSIKFNVINSFFINIEMIIKKKLIDRIIYWGSNKHKLSNYLLYVFFMDAAKVNFFISIFHFFFLCYFTYLLHFTTIFTVQNDFIYFYSILLCVLNIIFLSFRHFFSNRLLYWLFIIFFGMFNWFLFFSFLFVYFQVYDVISFKWFMLTSQMDVSALQKLLDELCFKYIGYLFYHDYSLFFLQSAYDVQLFFWSNFYDMFHVNPFHYYFILYFPIIRIPFFIILGIFFHIFLVLFFNFFIYFLLYFYTFLFIYRYSYKQIYQICRLFFLKIYYFYLGYVLLLFYFIFFFYLLYVLFTSFYVNTSFEYFYCVVPTSVHNILFPVFKKIGYQYYNSVMSTIGSSSFVPNNGKHISVVTDSSLEKGEDFRIIKLPEHMAFYIKQHGLGNYSYLVTRKNIFTHKLEAVFVKMDMPAQLSCSFSRNDIIIPEKMYSASSYIANTVDVYFSIKPNVSTKVDGHPLLVVSAVPFECEVSNYDLLILENPGLNMDRYTEILNMIVQQTFSDRSLAIRTGCIHFCSTGQKELPYDLITKYGMSLFSLEAVEKDGSVQFVTLHGSNIPHDHVNFHEQDTEGMLYFLLKNDLISSTTLVDISFNSLSLDYIHAAKSKRVLSNDEIEEKLFSLEKEYGTLDSSKLKFTTSDIATLSTPGYVGLSEIGTILSLEQMRFRSEQAAHQIKTYLVAKYCV